MLCQVIKTEENRALVSCFMLIWVGVGLCLLFAAAVGVREFKFHLYPCLCLREEAIQDLSQLGDKGCGLRASLNTPQRDPVSYSSFSLIHCYTGFLFGVVIRGRGMEACYYLIVKSQSFY